MNQKAIEDKILQSVAELKGLFQDVVLNLSHVLTNQELLMPNQLLPKNLFLDKFTQILTQELQGTQEQIKNGILALFHAAQDLQVGAEIDPDLQEALNKLFELCKNIANNRQDFIDALSRNKSLQQIAGISNATLEKLYLCAKLLYDEKRYQEAADAFSILTMLNSQNYVFWLGQGNSEFHLKHYDEALLAYAFVSRINPDDYYCHIYSCRCYEAQDQLENACNALELALFVLGDNPAEKELQLTLELQVKRLELAIYKRSE